MQAQADLNGDGTDEVLVSSHGTTIQARLLHSTYPSTAALSAPVVLRLESIHFPAALTAKMPSKKELVTAAMLTGPTYAKPDPTDSAAFVQITDVHAEAMILNMKHLPHSLPVCNCSITALRPCHECDAKHTASEPT